MGTIILVAFCHWKKLRRPGWPGLAVPSNLCFLAPWSILSNYIWNTKSIIPFQKSLMGISTLPAFPGQLWHKLNPVVLI